MRPFSFFAVLRSSAANALPRFGDFGMHSIGAGSTQSHSGGGLFSLSSPPIKTSQTVTRLPLEFNKEVLTVKNRNLHSTLLCDQNAGRRAY